VLNRLEKVVETIRAALNQLATTAPDWLKQVSPPEWFERYSRRCEQSRLPHGKAAREEFATEVADDGFQLLELLKEQQSDLLKLEKVEILSQLWQQHFTRGETGEMCWREGAEACKAADSIESPYDSEAKFSQKDLTRWTGYKVHLSETCDDCLPRLITNVHTTLATVQDVTCTLEIENSLFRKQLHPSRHFVDAGYIDADLLLQSVDKYGIELFGPTRQNPSWQSREGGIDATQFEIDWEKRQAICPAGKTSASWQNGKIKGKYAREVVRVKFGRKDCLGCQNRDKCVRSKVGGARQLLLPLKEFYLALKKTRLIFVSDEGRNEYRQRAGIEGTLSQGIRRGTMRRSRYIGLAKTHLQEVATASGINLLRTINFLNEKPLAKTRVSRFAKLAH
jgi:transposase